MIAQSGLALGSNSAVPANRACRTMRDVGATLIASLPLASVLPLPRTVRVEATFSITTVASGTGAPSEVVRLATTRTACLALQVDGALRESLVATGVVSCDDRSEAAGGTIATEYDASPDTRPGPLFSACVTATASATEPTANTSARAIEQHASMWPPRCSFMFATSGWLGSRDSIPTLGPLAYAARPGPKPKRLPRIVCGGSRRFKPCCSRTVDVAVRRCLCPASGPSRSRTRSRWPRAGRP